MYTAEARGFATGTGAKANRPGGRGRAGCEEPEAAHRSACGHCRRGMRPGARRATLRSGWQTPIASVGKHSSYPLHGRAAPRARRRTHCFPLLCGDAGCVLPPTPLSCKRKNIGRPMSQSAADWIRSGPKGYAGSSPRMTRKEGKQHTSHTPHTPPLVMAVPGLIRDRPDHFFVLETDLILDIE